MKTFASYADDLKRRPSRTSAALGLAGWLLTACSSQPPPVTERPLVAAQVPAATASAAAAPTAEAPPPPQPIEVEAPASAAPPPGGNKWTVLFPDVPKEDPFEKTSDTRSWRLRRVRVKGGEPALPSTIVQAIRGLSASFNACYKSHKDKFESVETVTVRLAILADGTVQGGAEGGVTPDVPAGVARCSGEALQKLRFQPPPGVVVLVETKLLFLRDSRYDIAYSDEYSGRGSEDDFGAGELGVVFDGVLVRAPKRVLSKVQVSALSVGKGLPRADIESEVQKRLGLFKLCYENGLRSNPTLQGKVVVTFTLGADGVIQDPKDEGSSMSDSNVTSCVIRRFYGMFVKVPTSGVVTYSLVFSPAAAAEAKR